MNILINPTVVSLSLVPPKNDYPYPTSGEVAVKDKNETELAKFTIFPISESQLKLFLDDKKTGNLYESVINKGGYSDIAEPIEIMLNRLNLTLRSVGV